jgi:hypothetical protein
MLDQRANAGGHSTGLRSGRGVGCGRGDLALLDVEFGADGVRFKFRFRLGVGFGNRAALLLTRPGFWRGDRLNLAFEAGGGGSVVSLGFLRGGRGSRVEVGSIHEVGEGSREAVGVEGVVFVCLWCV